MIRRFMIRVRDDARRAVRRHARFGRRRRCRRRICDRAVVNDERAARHLIFVIYF